jgi:hypothetical protein
MGYRLFIFSVLLFQAAAFGHNLPDTVKWPLGRAYIPVGFDDNDNAQVTVVGTFPSTCYKVGPAKSEVDTASHKIFLTQEAYQYSSDMCLTMMVPFTETINVGLVQAGQYQLVDLVSGSALGDMPITVSEKATPDDFLYVPVSDAYVRSNPATKIKELYLTGTMADRCTKLDRVEIHYYADTIVVQPIGKPVGQHCAGPMTRFQYSAPIPDAVKGTYLLHVRTMNGQAVNKLVDIE